MFYDNYVRLCNSVGKAPSVVAEEIGLYKSTVSNWKNRGTQPTDATLQKIAVYFGVSKEELLEEEKEKPTTEGELSEEERKFFEWYRTQATDRDKAIIRTIVNESNNDKQEE